MDEKLLTWLLDSDPALRWQVERDLVGEPEAVWRSTRDRIATEGFGARLLALQGDDGQWAGGAFFPSADQAVSEDQGAGQPWVATTPTLALLCEWGLDPAVLDGTVELLAVNSRWEYDGAPYWQGEVDCCINAEALAIGVWLGADIDALAQWFVEHRQPDGGWNCEWVEGSTRSSFPSTLNSLRGLLAYERSGRGTPELTRARKAGEEYLLERHLLHSKSTGQLIGDWATRFAYPFRWTYSALKAVDYFLDAAEFDAIAPDERLTEAVELIRSRRQPDGSWLQEVRHAGRAWFEVDVTPGEPSPWLTLYATRALRRWDRRAP